MNMTRKNIHFTISINGIDEFTYRGEYELSLPLMIANDIFNLPNNSFIRYVYEIDKVQLLTQIEKHLISNVLSPTLVKKIGIKYQVFINSLNTTVTLYSRLNSNKYKKLPYDYSKLISLCNFVYFWNCKTFIVDVRM